MAAYFAVHSNHLRHMPKATSRINRFLMWTLHRLAQHGLNRPDVRRDVGRAYSALHGTVRLDPRQAADCIGRFYHRLNDDYRPMHGLCRFLLEHSRPSVTAVERSLLPFALLMPQLFESFLAEWLRAELPPNFRLCKQHRVIVDATSAPNVIIDLVLEERRSGRVLAVLDTKYKADPYRIYRVRPESTSQRGGKALLMALTQ